MNRWKIKKQVKRGQISPAEAWAIACSLNFKPLINWTKQRIARAQRIHGTHGAIFRDRNGRIVG